MNANQLLLRFLSIIIILLTAAVLISPIPAGAIQYQIKLITNNGDYASTPKINDIGQVYWYMMDKIYLYTDGSPSQPTQITDSCLPPLFDINDRGDVIWMSNYLDGVYLYSSGHPSKVINFPVFPVTNCKINNKGQIVFSSGSVPTDLGVYLYDNGNTTLIDTSDCMSTPVSIHCCPAR
jgi:hypothetical protein